MKDDGGIYRRIARAFRLTGHAFRRPLAPLSFFFFASIAAFPIDGAVREIEFWHSMSHNAKSVVEDMVEEYNGTREDVRVKAVFQGSYDTMEVKLLEAANTGKLPTVAQEQFEFMGNYIDEGHLKPIGSLVGERDRRDILPEFWDLASRKGEIYGIPFGVSTTVFFYNRDAFKKAGLDPATPPGTWEEMVEMGKRISESSSGEGKPRRYSYFLWKDGFYGWAPLLWALGGELFSKDGRVDLHNEAMIRALSALRNLVLTDGIMSRTLPDWRAGLSFLRGNVVMGPFSSAGLAFGMERLPFDLGVAPLPSINGKRYTVLGGSALVNFARDPRAREDANDFALWLVNSKNTIKLHRRIGYIPVRKSAQESAELKTFHRENPEFLVPIRAVRYARPLPYHREYFSINNALVKLMDRIIKEGVDPLAELSRTERELARFY
jgi:ABC-type glycerol-3-phosphate transport system substrate-binding protein